ncbi:hypothetical protein TrLO_g1902 [Triparma laevis f. longispina]|uniref:1-alkyl-2-acetylglycerophosphocholine esterase n=1 Tax=Triparma laevis f. longispina TaxID=1714387 RepID=A0A9W7FJ28_9STRA|nr:hypothetical protein TrLO_g1902 [Triparma laevis f. longispina]
MYYPSKNVTNYALCSRKKWLPSYAHAGNWSSFIGLPYHLLGSVSSLYFTGTKVFSPHNLQPKEVAEGVKRPLIIFSHGLASWGNHYSCLLSYLSSFGYTIITFDHTDGSATVAELNSGIKEYEYVNEKNIEYMKKRRGEQLDLRVNDIKNVWNFIKNYEKGGGTIIETVLKNTNRESFIIAGHSFGGGTAYACLESEKINPPPKAGILFDPWLNSFKWSSSFKNWKNEMPKVILTCDKGFISKTPKWRKQLEPISSMINAKSVRFPGQDHIDVCDAPLFLPFSTKSDQWFIENMWEVKEFLKGIGEEIEGDLEKELEVKRGNYVVEKFYESPF